MTTLLLSKATGNVFEGPSNTCADTVHMDRIGFIDEDGDFIERSGIGWTLSTGIVARGIESGFFIPMVRLIGGSLMRESEYVDTVTIAKCDECGSTKRDMELSGIADPICCEVVL